MIRLRYIGISGGGEVKEFDDKRAQELLATSEWEIFKPFKAIRKNRNWKR